MHNNKSEHWLIIEHCDDCSSCKETPKCHQIVLSETSKWLVHQCSLCLKTFQDCRSLQLHKRSNFDWRVKRTYNSNNRCSFGKQIVQIGAQCDICWKLFSTKQSLAKHKQTQHIIPTVFYLKKNEPKKHGHWVLGEWGSGGWKWVPLDPSVDLASLPTREEQFVAYHESRRRMQAASTHTIAPSNTSSAHATTVTPSSQVTSVASVTSSSPLKLGDVISVAST